MSKLLEQAQRYTDENGYFFLTEERPSSNDNYVLFLVHAAYEALVAKDYETFEYLKTRWSLLLTKTRFAPGMFSRSDHTSDTRANSHDNLEALAIGSFLFDGRSTAQEILNAIRFGYYWPTSRQGWDWEHIVKPHSMAILELAAGKVPGFFNRWALYYNTTQTSSYNLNRLRILFLHEEGSFIYTNTHFRRAIYRYIDKRPWKRDVGYYKRHGFFKEALRVNGGLWRVTP